VGKLNHTVIRVGLESLYFSGAHHVLQPFAGGIGAILMLHHVRPAKPDAFQPNRLLEITPEYLERIVTYLRGSGLDLVSLDEAYRRIAAGQTDRRFVVVTLDDGYRDVQQYAYPIFKAHQVPFTMYIATSFAEHSGELWWLALEAVIARNGQISLVMGGAERHFDCATTAAKYETFAQIYWWLRSLPTEEDLRGAVRDLAARYRVDILGFCKKLCMTWDELAQMAQDPLVTIAAHTVNHVILKKVSESDVMTEMAASQAKIQAALGVTPAHFAYPVGDATAAGPREFKIAAELGFKTAVTTRPGVIFPEHRDHLLALPRISVNGEFQKLRYFQVLLSGAATGLANRFRHVNAA